MIASTGWGFHTDDAGKMEIIRIISDNAKNLGVFYRMAVRDQDDHCLYSVYAMVNVLRAFGFEAAPLAAVVTISNKSHYIERIDRHVVTAVIVGDRSIMIDISIPYAVKMGVVVPPIVTFEGTLVKNINVWFGNGLAVNYRFQPKNKWYAKQSGWDQSNIKTKRLTAGFLGGLIAAPEAIITDRVKVNPGGGLDVVCPHCLGDHDLPLPPGYLAGETFYGQQWIEQCPETKKPYEIIFGGYGRGRKDRPRKETDFAQWFTENFLRKTGQIEPNGAEWVEFEKRLNEAGGKTYLDAWQHVRLAIQETGKSLNNFADVIGQLASTKTKLEIEKKDGNK